MMLVINIYFPPTHSRDRFLFNVSAHEDPPPPPENQNFLRNGKIIFKECLGPPPPSQTPRRYESTCYSVTQKIGTYLVITFEYNVVHWALGISSSTEKKYNDARITVL